MSLKTIEIPSSQRVHAELLHRLLLTPPPFLWELVCPSVVGAGGLQVPSPTLRIHPDPTSPSGSPAWLQLFESAELTVIPVASLVRILRGLDSLSLGNVSAKLLRSLSRETLRSDQITAGRLPLPEISVEVDHLPDPVTEALTALPSQPAFLLHLRGRFTKARFDVRLTY